MSSKIFFCIYESYRHIEVKGSYLPLIWVAQKTHEIRDDDM